MNIISRNLFIPLIFQVRGRFKDILFSAFGISVLFPSSLFVYLCICLTICLGVCVCISVCLSVLPVYHLCRSVYLSVSQSVRQSNCLSIHPYWCLCVRQYFPSRLILHYISLTYSITSNFLLFFDIYLSIFVPYSLSVSLSQLYTSI